MANRLRLFDTMRGRKVPFKSMEPGRVKMFVCGPTVQGPMHMGHARTYVFYDVLARYLGHLGYRVTYVMNITDVDERVSQEAAKVGKDPLLLAREIETGFLKDMRNLGINTVTSFPRVSDYIQEMKRQISTLIEKGFGYPVDGWVYFDTSRFPDFGKLSHQSKRELSLRPLELSLRKRNLLDFSLWRPEVLVEGRWKSPWGQGSPGWHIQDTAVTHSLLGSSYDLHGGAYELIYPHHEAEIAQSESFTGVKPLVRHWVHTRLVQMSGEKMSKSAGNVYTAREALKRYSPREIRYFLLSKHYREDMSLDGMESKAVEFRGLRSRVSRLTRGASRKRGSGSGDASLEPFFEAMNDDIDTPAAIGQIRELVSLLASSKTTAQRQEILDALETSSHILGIDLLGGT